MREAARTVLGGGRAMNARPYRYNAGFLTLLGGALSAFHCVSASAQKDITGRPR